ncbi:MAG TPA: peptide chain release factor 2 [Chloroflexia bacterium]|nr:peptide chain release factor 2 [Chloroflexia bacterium]
MALLTHESIIDTLNEMNQRIQEIEVRLDLAGKAQEITELDRRTLAPTFWEDAPTAQAVMQRRNALQEHVDLWRGVAAQARDLRDLYLLAEAENNAEVLTEVGADTERLLARFDKLELDLVLSGRYDSRNAFVSIFAREGGTEAQDWVEMLLREVTRWAELRNWKPEILDLMEGDEAGIKSVTLAVRGLNAFGYSRFLAGVHRLVRISPFDSSGRRHTSFALIEVMPEIEDDIEVQINPDEIKMDVYRSAGAGGQNVQKNSTAVRLTHIPTGIVATCQNERSQLQNREFALRILRARLWEIEVRKRAEETARIKGKHVDVGWGSQILNYVLHPYKMVKDLRTGYETSNTEAVLNGELDPFVEAWLRWQLNDEAGLDVDSAPALPAEDS